MIVAFWCVLVAGLLPLGCAYVAKFGSNGTSDPSPRFDNAAPRAWLATQTGRRARADAAQANSYESFPFFAAGVVIAVVQHVPVATIDTLAIVYLVARVGFIACYLTDRASARSLFWVAGFAACVALYLFAATGTLR